MEINQENTKYFLKKSTKFLCYVFPGMVVMDLFFDKGFFSNGIDSLYAFLIYTVWVLVISIPFHHFNSFAVEEFIMHVMKRVGKLKEFSMEESKEVYENLSEDDKELFSDHNSQIVFGAVIIKTVLFYLIYKISVFYNLICFSLFDITSQYLLFAFTIFTTIVLGYPLGYIYAKYNIYSFSKRVEEDFFKE
jgi:hypothetical protein